MTNASEPPTDLTYGSTVHLWQKDLGYLCAGKPVDPSALAGVSRPVAGSDDKNKTQVQSVWRVIPTGMNAKGWRSVFGKPVKVGDAIHLLSCSSSATPIFPDAGYLRSYELVKNVSALNCSLSGNWRIDKVALGVVTHPDPDSEMGSAAWTIGKTGAGIGAPVYENDAISLRNVYHPEFSGWLVAYSSPRAQPESFDNYEAEGQVTDVFTSTADDPGGAQRWTLIPVDFSTLKRSAEL